jgi:3-hydroxyisobutyrate dehydrogenase-like beta-hydroxyacid dehydrogenase
MDKKRIGFIGLGLMGSGMARNLVAAGFPLVGYDVDESKVEAMVRLGGKRAESPEQIPREVDLIILSLPNSHVVNEVVEKSLKLFETGRKGLVLIDTTTADPILSKELALRLRKKGIEMLDATLSGTSKMCADREITIMVGGSEEIYGECKDVWGALGKETFFMGENGSGALTKLIVNLVLGLNRMVLAEGLALTKRLGMDQYRLLEVLKGSAAYSKAMDMKGSKMIEKDFLPPEGKLAFHLKDVQLMLDLGKRHHFPLLLSSLHAQALASEVAKGRGEWDNADIISFYEDLANLK